MNCIGETPKSNPAASSQKAKSFRCACFSQVPLPVPARPGANSMSMVAQAGAGLTSHLPCCVLLLRRMLQCWGSAWAQCGMLRAHGVLTASSGGPQLTSGPSSTSGPSGSRLGAAKTRVAVRSENSLKIFHFKSKHLPHLLISAPFTWKQQLEMKQTH